MLVGGVLGGGEGGGGDGEFGEGGAGGGGEVGDGGGLAGVVVVEEVVPEHEVLAGFFQVSAVYGYSAQVHGFHHARGESLTAGGFDALGGGGGLRGGEGV